MPTSTPTAVPGTAPPRPRPRRVLLIGAYERDNLGDLLFLLVTERYLGAAEVIAAAPFAADMRAQLDRHVPAYGPLLEREPFDAIWTVGGQVGRVDLRRAYRMSAPPDRWRRFARSSPQRQAEILRDATGGAPIGSPYVPLAAAYPRNAGATTILNSVGLGGPGGAAGAGGALDGGGAGGAPGAGGAGGAILPALRAATAIAVRDRGSSRLLERLGIGHRLVPDAVHALGVLDPFEPAPGAGPAIVQVSRARLRMLGHARVGAALARSLALARLPIRLLGAGTATGHDSIADYERVVSAARRARRGVDIAILGERRPLALVERIRRAAVVVGTSLHVRVVAAAYGVPRVSLSKPKPTRYARQWDAEMPHDVALEHLDGAIAAAVAHARTRAARAHARALALAADANLRRLAREAVHA